MIIGYLLNKSCVDRLSLYLLGLFGGLCCCFLGSYLLPFTFFLILILQYLALHAAFKCNRGGLPNHLVLVIEPLLQVKMLLQDLIFAHLLLVSLILTNLRLFFSSQASRFLTVIGISTHSVLERDGSLLAHSFLLFLLTLGLYLILTLLALDFLNFLSDGLKAFVSLLIVEALNVFPFLCELHHLFLFCNDLVEPRYP